ncbi:unnamed protein product, partial [Orchesella dallaii]
VKTAKDERVDEELVKVLGENWMERCKQRIQMNQQTGVPGMAPTPIYEPDRPTAADETASISIPLSLSEADYDIDILGDYEDNNNNNNLFIMISFCKGHYIMEHIYRHEQLLYQYKSCNQNYHMICDKCHCSVI